MQLIDSVNALSGVGRNTLIPAGDYSHIVMRFAGTNNSGQTGTLDTGRLRLTLNQQDFVNMDFDMLNYINDLEGGYPEFTSTDNSTFVATAIIPASYFGLPNIIHVGLDDRLVLNFTYNANQINTTVLASCTYTVGAIKAKGIQTYWRKMMHEVPSLPAGTDPETFDAVENLIAMYWNNPNTTYIERLLVEIDDVVFANASAGELQAISNQLHEKEAGYTSLYGLNVTQGLNIGEALSDKVKVTFTCGTAETPDIILCGIDFDIDRLNKSRNEFLSKFSQTVRGKQAKGRFVPAELINQPITDSPIQPKPIKPQVPLA